MGLSGEEILKQQIRLFDGVEKLAEEKKLAVAHGDKPYEAYYTEVEAQIRDCLV